MIGANLLPQLAINYTGIKKDEVDCSDDYSQLSNRYGIVIKFREQLQQLDRRLYGDFFTSEDDFPEHTSGF